MVQGNASQTFVCVYMNYGGFLSDEDSGEDSGAQDPCVVTAIYSDYRNPVEKRDSTATLSRGECTDPCLDRLLLFFWAHYMEDDPHLLGTGSLWMVTFYRKQRRGCC